MKLNGEPVRMDDLKALALTNYGHFTSMRVDDGRVRGLALHLNRLVRDCCIMFDAELDPDHVRALVRDAIADVTGSFVVRVTVFDPALELGHPGSKAVPTVLVTTRPTAALPLPALRVQSVRYQRDLPQVKHVGLLGQIRHRRLAQLNGYDDALFVGPGSYVSEGATWNIGFYDGARVVWPEGDVLRGVTMDLLNEVHGPTVVSRVSLAEVHGMVAAFATNTSVGVRPIRSIDSDTFPETHPIIAELQDAYMGVPGDLL